ncbi:hypothetical protein CYMTET_5792, partial [Cymbomonas tetramitiformis]
SSMSVFNPKNLYQAFSHFAKSSREKYGRIYNQQRRSKPGILGAPAGAPAQESSNVSAASPTAVIVNQPPRRSFDIPVSPGGKQGMPVLDASSAPNSRALTPQNSYARPFTAHSTPRGMSSPTTHKASLPPQTAHSRPRTPQTKTHASHLSTVTNKVMLVPHQQPTRAMSPGNRPGASPVLGQSITRRRHNLGNNVPNLGTAHLLQGPGAGLLPYSDSGNMELPTSCSMVEL